MKASWPGWSPVGYVDVNIGKTLLVWVCDKGSLGSVLTLTGAWPVRLACFADAM
jgi:hypothetical protein